MNDTIYYGLPGLNIVLQERNGVKLKGVSQLWYTLVETLHLGFVRCPSSVEPRFRSSFLLPSSGEQDDTNRYLLFLGISTGRYSGVDFGLLLTLQTPS
jgi:hypothetical protein